MTLDQYKLLLVTKNDLKTNTTNTNSNISSSQPQPQPQQQPLSYVSSKTIPCRFYQRNGSCMYGDNCRFSHDPLLINNHNNSTSATATTITTTTTTTIDYRKNMTCKFFFSKSGCFKGNACPFSHVMANMNNNNNNNNNNNPAGDDASVNSSSTIHKYYHKVTEIPHQAHHMTSNRYHVYLSDASANVLRIPNMDLESFPLWNVAQLESLNSFYSVSPTPSFDGEEIVQVETASDLYIGAHTMYLSKNGVCFGQGSNAGGQLATSLTVDCMFPTKVHSETFLQEGETIVKIATGNGHTIFITQHGSAYSCGLAEFGQLGLGDLSRVCVPKKIEFEQDEEAFIVDVRCGSDHTLCLTRQGTVYGFGKNSLGQLGLDKLNKRVTKPTIIPIKAKVIQISTKSDHSAFLTENGEVFMCGNNNFGQCSHGGSIHVTPPRKVDFSEPITGVFCCEYTTAIVSQSNGVYMFGDNDNYMILEKNTTMREDTHSVFAPTQLSMPRIAKKWTVASICSTYRNQEIIISLKMNEQHLGEMGRKMLKQTTSLTFVDTMILCSE